MRNCINRETRSYDSNVAKIKEKKKMYKRKKETVFLHVSFASSLLRLTTIDDVGFLKIHGYTLEDKFMVVQQFSLMIN